MTSRLPRQASLSANYTEPSQRIKVLVDYGSQVEVDKTLALKLYFRSLRELLRMANMYCDEGQLESAFILYYKFITLFVEKLPAHPDYHQAHHDELQDFKRKVKKVFPIAEEIKSKLKKKYAEDEQKYLEHQRQLAIERAAEEERRRKALEEQERMDEELARKLQDEEEAEAKSQQEEKYWRLRHQEEERLREEQERKKHGLKTSPGGVLTQDLPGAVSRAGAVAADGAGVFTQTANSPLPLLPDDASMSGQEIPPPPSSLVPPPPSYSDYLSEISVNPPQVPDRELKKKLVVSDNNVLPPNTIIVDRSKKPIVDHHTSLGEFGGLKVGQLRSVIIPSQLMPEFLKVAAGNTANACETMGILCGRLSQGVFKITNLFVPQQKGGHDSCDMEKEEELISYQDQHNLITLGWIHTHPTQTAFLSSVDLHSHFPWQKMFPEAVAIVCSPKFDETGIFRLTDEGLDVIGRCQEKGFHPHSREPPLFETCGHVEISSRDAIKVDNKMKL